MQQTPRNQTKSRCVNANKGQNISVTAQLPYFKKKNNLTTTQRNNYFQLFDINCRYHFLVKSFNLYALLVSEYNLNFVA